MNTAKPISTISFNSEEFLRAKLEELQKAHIISVWAYIFHDPEPDESRDEAGKKAHAHVYIEPSKRINTDLLREEFREADLSRADKKPRGCIKFVNSVFADWFLYGMHDESYLAKHEQGRIHHYTDTDFVVSDEDDWRFLVSSVDRLQLSEYDKMRSAIKRGVSFGDYISRGTVPVQQIALFEKAYDIISNNLFTRNARPGHDQVIDTKTGEISEVPLPEPLFGSDKEKGSKSDCIDDS